MACLLALLLLFLAPSSATPAGIRLPSKRACELQLPSVRACAAPPDPAVYDRPVIGIVSHPGDGASGRISNATATSYIAASYVKFVESAGARVIPLIYNEPEERLLEKLSLVNGVLFTGGSEKHGSYFETIKKVFQYALDRNDAGVPFPLFAECLGFELVSMIVSKDNNILETFSAVNQASTLQFPNYSSLEGSVFERFDPDLIKKLSTSCLVMQNHKYGISPKRLRENDALSSFFKILTTSPDENGEVYVSTVQAHKYPITCTQWHPEKAIFEWGKPMIPHSEDAVRVTQNFANYFVSQARKSPNRPPADKVLDNLIYNYKPTFSGKTSKSFEEMKERRPLYMLKGPLENAPHARDFVGALKASYDRTGLPALIAEVKKASPSRGVLRENFDPGSFDYLEAIRNSGVKCPLLCKEFIVDAWQLHYARSKGADAVLLIAAVLPDLDIKYMLKICKILRMAALVEVHDEREMDRVLGIDGIQLIGINNDLNRAHTLICCAAIPPFC